MGRKSRLKKERRSKNKLIDFVCGERIWFDDPLGMVPNGIYTYQGNKYGMVGLNGIVGLTFDGGIIGIKEEFLDYARKLTKDEARLPETTEEDIVRHRLASSQAYVYQECEECKRLAANCH